jgi:hypothetical protein
MLEIERKMLEIRKSQDDLGVATESMNRLPLFEPTTRPNYKIRTFNSKYGKITIDGRLGQVHKSLLETILYLRKFYDLRVEENKVRLTVLFNEYEVKKYMSQGSVYGKETYERLIKDMSKAQIRLQKGIEYVEGSLITSKLKSKLYSRRTKSNLPDIKGTEIPYIMMEFGDAASLLLATELRFTYDPKPIMELKYGISQAIVRYLKTHRSHPSTGYHLKALLENLIENVEGDVWKNIRRFLKKDAEQLEKLGVVIDFKKDRLFVIQDTLKLKSSKEV